MLNPLRSLLLAVCQLLPVALCACTENPTQLVVAIDADPILAEHLTRIVVSTYDPDDRDNLEPAGQYPFALGERSAPGVVKFPFSLGIEKRDRSSFLLVVTGYEGDTLVIERKAKVAFESGHTRGLGIYLEGRCYNAVCGDENSPDWFDRTCSAEQGGICEDVPTVATVPASPNTSLERLLDAGAPTRELDAEAGGDDPDMDAGPDGDTEPEAAGPEADASQGEAGPLDGDTDTGTETGPPETGTDTGPAPTCETCPTNATCNTSLSPARCVCNSGYKDNGAGGCETHCASSPCGSLHTCVNGASDYSCTCAATHRQGATSKTCVAKFAGLAAGYDHTCAWRTDGTLWCWGDNGGGQLGRPGGFSRVPVQVGDLSDVTGVSGGTDHTCALRTGGVVACFGENVDAQLGRGAGNTTSTSTPSTVAGLNASAVAVGVKHSCALRTDGSVVCWGDNDDRQLGAAGSDTGVPLAIVGVAMANRVRSGGFNACALRTDNSALCWGSNSYGQLANNTTVGVGGSGPTAWGSGLIDIAAGEGHICAVTATNVLCSGRNDRGQLGTGNTTELHVATAVSVASPAQIALGMEHTCVRQAGGTVMCWGSNEYGQLGNGGNTNVPSPVAVSGLTTATALTAGAGHSCALRSDGEIVCWGANEVGQLGSGSTAANSLTPVVVSAF